MSSNTTSTRTTTMPLRRPVTRLEPTTARRLLPPRPAPRRRSAAQQHAPRARRRTSLARRAAGADAVLAVALTVAIVLLPGVTVVEAGALTGILAAWILVVALHRGYRPRRSVRPALRARLAATAIVAIAALLAGQALPIGGVDVIAIVALLVLAAGSFTVMAITARAAAGRHLTLTTSDADPGSSAAGSALAIDPVVLSDLDELARLIRDAAAAGGFLSVELPVDRRLSGPDLQRVVWMLRGEGLDISLALHATGNDLHRLHLVSAGERTVLDIDCPQPGVLARAAKRGLDVVVSSALILVLSPLLIGSAIAVRLSGPGSILYRQERIGQGGAAFMIYKFRTMVPGADRQLAGLLAAQQRDGQPLFKVDDDPRITRLGHVMRRYSIDELPQLFNVLNGTMSLVGPRPQRAPEVRLYAPGAFDRLDMRPGMTGLWQVSGRTRLSWEKAIALDLRYVHNWTLGLDLRILLRTARAVLGADGAQ